MTALVAKALAFVRSHATLFILILALCGGSAFYGHWSTASYYKAKIEALRSSYIVAAAKQDVKTAETKLAQKEITHESQTRYQQRRARIDAALVDKRVRDTTNSGSVPSVPDTSCRTDDAPRECVPIAEHRELKRGYADLEARCVADALKLEELQTWNRNQASLNN